ncbi:MULTISPECIES: hypothetical protein [Bacillaceae]|uniref:hypothetical protein n=1 Tax=Bacillaceae TaxID=186817 RepID=UPI002A0B48CE|nr:hypothetical protein [Cytobacillus sp. IB215316]MDX8362147.1 hypothetical protein [Cytobacillus sp. IB215316]
MSAYASKSSCCGSTTKALNTVEKTACCDCPVPTCDFMGTYRVEDTDPFQIYCGASTPTGVLCGTITLISGDGLEINITTNGSVIPKIIRPTINLPDNSNSISFSFPNVTDITANCLDDEDSCRIEYSFRTIERCISTSVPNQ